MDYSQSLFSHMGWEPDYLPERMRLPSGQTRYSYSVTRIELLSMGYTGPYEKPDCPDGHHVVWDSEALSYSVQPGVGLATSSQVDACENAKAISLLNSRIVNSISSSNEDGIYTEEFIKEHSVYKGNLLDLYFKTDHSYLCCDDIPSPPKPTMALVTEKNKYLNQLASGAIDGYKQQYESFGVIPDIHPDLVDFLPLPGSDWTRGSGLLDVEGVLSTASGDLVVKPHFGRNCFS